MTNAWLAGKLKPLARAAELTVDHFGTANRVVMEMTMCASRLCNCCHSRAT
ncbi:hypothetical protein [Antarctobacter sp.]|uniref:hypothetical protein n=1 Tax=Antarctobacter sp. TaxID=1872577 RepID=UPI003A92E7BE